MAGGQSIFERRREEARRAVAPWTDPNARPLVRFENVTKRFGRVAAVDTLSLDIYEKEFFALLGPSGCGKTTLLRLLAGFETPNEGRIVLADDDIVAVPPHRRPVNMMFQNYALFPHLNVEGNIAFGLKQDGLPKPEIAARVEQMLTLVKLDGFAKRKIDELSGGQQQRVALARALVKRPKVLLLDEPLAALDRKLREETRFELMALQKELGLTFVIVTHDREEAMTVADRVAVMERGKISQVGAPSEIYEKPSSRFIADFIGDVNVIQGRVVSVSGEGAVIEAVGAGRLSVAEAGSCKQGDLAWLAVRPEKIRISHEMPMGAGLNQLAGHVADIAYLGDVSIYKVWLDNGLVVRATAANLTRLIERPIGWEDRVWVSWPPGAGILLTR